MSKRLKPNKKLPHDVIDMTQDEVLSINDENIPSAIDQNLSYKREDDDVQYVAPIITKSSSSSRVVQPNRSTSSSSKPASKRQFKSAAVEPSDFEVNDPSESEQEKVQLFRLTTSIVGKRYYSGRMNDGEIVYLVREPRNPYDSNAIKVLSLNRAQVGHIIAKDGTAGALSALADYKLPNNVGGDLEGVVLSGSKNVYKAQVDVTIVGILEDKIAIGKWLTHRGIPHQDISTGESKLGYVSHRNSQSQPGGSQSSRKSTSAPHNYQVLSEEDVIKQLDGIWEQQDKEISDLVLQSEHEMLINAYLKSPLYPHQRQGLAWMLSKELDTTKLPIFYEERKVNGQTTFFHSILKYDYQTRPSNIQGGLLCDDMGLGKSLITLALIIANTPCITLKSVSSHPVPLAEQTAFKKCQTLIVCPVSVMSAWQQQVEDHVQDGLLKVFIYHGTSKFSSVSELDEFDIVITSYQTLAQDRNVGKNKKKRKSSGFLENISWHRIVLDEGHYVRNMKTDIFQGCDQLEGKYRWYLTGTPITNSVADIESALRFLRLEPFSSDPALYKRYIVRPIKSNDFDAVIKLRTMMKVLALRRLKGTIESNLPPKQEIIVSVELSPTEREAYDAISAAVADFMAFAKSLDGGQSQIMKNSSTILGLITRLRQCCLDFSLVPVLALVDMLSNYNRGKGTENINITRLTKEEQEELLNRFQQMFSRIGTTKINGTDDNDESPLECCICMNILNEEDSKMFVSCKHTLCRSCVDRLFEMSSIVKCPLCRMDVTRNDCVSSKALRNSIEKEDDSSEEKSSTVPNTLSRSSKTSEIVKAIRNIQEHQPDEKIVIFSSFVSYLNILKRNLEDDGFTTTMLVGSMTHKQRTDAMSRFAEDDNVRVILCSLKAAGVGITLTKANHIFLTDLWWSPAADLQAIDRVHRLGQTRVVQVKRFIAARSIDEKIYALQKKKMQLSKLTFELSAEQAREQRYRDFEELLS